MKVLTTATGWIGMFLIVLAYILISLQYAKGNSMSYQFINIVGASCLGINAFYQKAWPIVVLEIVWILIAIVSLVGLK